MSLSSMTGFARGSGDLATLHWVCEIKSLNGRGLDVRCRTPVSYETLEPAIRMLVSERLSRGSVQINLSVERRTATTDVKINRPLLEQILRIVAELEKVQGVAAARLDGLLAIKGVLEVGEASESESERASVEAALLQGVADALDRLVSARKAEGKHLLAVLLDHVVRIETLTQQAAAIAARFPEAAKHRIKEQLAILVENTSALDPARLAQEAALIASRADIAEELDRLRAHIAQARELLSGNGPAGRKLEFLTQEFNREANTLCSKSSAVELTRIGLELKAVIDQFREQIQNVE